MQNDWTTNRRKFLQKSALLAAGTFALGNQPTWAQPTPLANPLPRWKGFNLLDFFAPDPANSRPATTEQHLKWMADWGFDFVRLPMAYPSYVSFDRSKPIQVEQVRNIDTQATDKIEQLVFLAHKHGLHVSLNLHRAPGFCVNAGFEEPYNLWQDAQAMDDFVFHWSFWAKRFAQTSPDKISFDLLNEPCTREDMNDQHSKRGPIPGELYRKMAIQASEAIRAANPKHRVIADGNNVGSNVIPEITDLDIGQSCRGYHPGIISHYKAPWVFKEMDQLPEPKWPGQVGNQYLSRAMLETMYEPWIALTKQGVGVHCGECGCFNKTPHAVFLAWFEDVLDILTEHKIGYALWEFRGSFGMLDSGRDDVAYEDHHGYKLDRKLLTLLQKY
ncbi:glycoside hydrolase family 5 protein [Arundinibacter roseus]|uniref:Glycosyl hydrolase family 5 n=1 Tax=Arundinibacter roseus TaxID=2070510 RepID=A0A4R4KJD7_9BACT|nr:cellulase family glycosylhydrolase [Arundinibacter roseus]TDB68063.1 glycosyl hydrolase family 5 [Arundinibacter roseus]